MADTAVPICRLGVGKMLEVTTISSGRALDAVVHGRNALSLWRLRRLAESPQRKRTDGYARAGLADGEQTVLDAIVSGFW